MSADSNSEPHPSTSQPLTSQPLLAPGKLGPFTLANRVVMAPLTRGRAQMPGNVPWQLNAEYYAQRASAGLIVSEAVLISPQAGVEPGLPGIYTEEQIAGWQLVTDAVHQKQGRIFAQLWHRGRQANPRALPDGLKPVAPSAVPLSMPAPSRDGSLQPAEPPRALELEEIASTIEDYRQAAKNALKAGFDGIELHSANGYLIEQFLSDQANQREDHYGGSIENRARFLLEVVDAVCSVWPAQQVGVRFSPANKFGDMYHSDRWGTYSWVMDQISRRHALAYVHLIEPRIAGNVDTDGSHLEHLASCQFRQFLRPETRLIAAGGYTAELGNAVLTEGQADFVAYGRLFISNPDLPIRFARGAELTPYQRETFYTRDAVGYTDYHSLEES